MNMKPYPLLAIAFLALAACRPAATEWTENEASKRIRLDNASVAVNVRFAPGSAHLLPADAARLRTDGGNGRNPALRPRRGRGGRRPGACGGPPRCDLSRAVALRDRHEPVGIGRRGDKPRRRRSRTLSRHDAGLPQLEQGVGNRFYELVPEQLGLRQSDEPWPDGRQPVRSRLRSAAQPGARPDRGCRG